MASANQRKATFISRKLKLLKDQEDHLINDVRLYVSRIITAAESWLEGRDVQIEYHELHRMIDNAGEFLRKKSEELAGGSVDVPANQLSRPSREQSNLETQVKTVAASSSTTSYRETAGGEGTESQVELVKKFANLSSQLESVKDRINVLHSRIDRIVEDCNNKQEGMNTVTNTLAEKIMTNTQTVQVIFEIQDKKATLLRELEARLQTLEAASGRHVKDLQKQTENEEDNVFQEAAVMAPRLQQLDENQLKPILARIAVIEEALCSFRNNAEKVAEQQSGIDEQPNEILSTLSESDKKHSSRFRKVKEQISEISDVQDAINEEHRTRLQSLERQLQKVSTAQDRLGKEVELQAELAEKLVHLPNQLEAAKENFDKQDARIERIIDDCVKENIKVLNTRTDRIIDECSIKHEDIKTVTDDLVDKVTANTHTIQVISEGQEQKMSLMRELETRLKTLEADGGRNVKDFQKQAEKGEANLSQVLQDVTAISSKLQQLELKCSGISCGFSAGTRFYGGGTEGNISKYIRIYSNVGDNFNADSGIFTAPVDGLYVASVSLYLTVNEYVYVQVRHQQCLDTESTNVCSCSAEVKNTTGCGVGVVDMKADDKLFTFVSGLPTDENQLKPILARIAVIEEALCSFRNNAEKVAEQQSGIDEQPNEILSTLSESDKKHSSRFRKVKEQISEISDVQDAINEEHRTRLQSLERQLQKVSTAQDRLGKEVELQAELAEKLVHLPNQLEAAKENFDKQDARIERIIDDCVKENIKVLNTRTDRIIDECSIKHDYIKTVTDDLVDKVTANTHTIQVISEGEEQKMTLMRELETRLKTLEADGGRNVKDLQKQAEKGEANLSQVLQDVTAISSKLQQLELKCSGISCGFSAGTQFYGGGTEGNISKYIRIYSNVGDNFNADSGIFTAPVDGLYVASVSLYLTVNEYVYVQVRHQQCLDTESTNVCSCSAEVKNTTGCGVGVVDMKADDKLFTFVSGLPTGSNLIRLFFTCFLLR